jgi:hypothetical protein
VLVRGRDSGKAWFLERPENLIDSENDDIVHYKDSPGINFSPPSIVAESLVLIVASLWQSQPFELIALLPVWKPLELA